MTRNTFEEELDAIRVQLYEDTKDMSSDDRVAYFKAVAEPDIKKHNMKIGVPPATLG